MPIEIFDSEHPERGKQIVPCPWDFGSAEPFDDEKFLAAPDEEGQTVTAGAPPGALKLPPAIEVVLPNGEVETYGWTMASAEPAIDPFVDEWRNGAYITDAEFKSKLQPKKWTN